MALVSGGSVQKRSDVQFAGPSLGGSFVKLKHSEEKIPVEFVNEKYVGVLMDTDQFAAAVL